jgi:hypothetical protein
MQMKQVVVLLAMLCCSVPGYARQASTFGAATRICDGFPGSSAGARIAACIADLPPGGGTADARSLGGAQSITENIVFGKPVRLLLGPGTYTFLGDRGPAFTLFAGSVLQGQGQGLTILKAGTDTADGIAGAADALITNVTVRGNVKPEPGSSGIDGCDCSNLTIDHVTVENWGGHGINTGGKATNWNIRNSTVRNNHDDGILLIGSGHVVEGNLVERNGSNGIDNNSSRARIVNNSVISNGEIYYKTLGYDCAGILLAAIGASTDGNIIAGNQVRDNRCNQIIIQPAEMSHTANYNIVKGNIISGGSGKNAHGIAIDTSSPQCGTGSYNSIEGNTIFSVSGNGILIGGGDPGVKCTIDSTVILNNQIIGSAGVGIHVYWGTGTMLAHNTVLNNIAGQISLGVARRTVDFCNITDSTVNSCGLAAGTLAVNAIRPNSGSQLSLTSDGNTRFTLTSTAANRHSWSLYVDESGKLNVYDDTLVSNRMSIDSAGTLGVVQNLMAGVTVQAGVGFRIGTAGPTITAGNEPPAGECVTGALFLRVNGQPGSTLHVCEASAWVAK